MNTGLGLRLGLGLGLGLGLALALCGCSAMTSSAGSNLASGGKVAGDAGCGAVAATFGGTGNGGLCLTPPGMIGNSTVNPNGGVSITVTGWAFNPLLGVGPTGGVLVPTPVDAAERASPK